MILSINLQSSSFSNPPGKQADTMEEAIATAFHDKFKGYKDYKDNNVLVNFEHAEGDQPASVSVFIDIDSCTELKSVFMRFQQAFVDYMHRTYMSKFQSEAEAIMPVDPESGSVG